MKPKKPIATHPLHPSDKALRDFIDGRLSPKEQKKIIEHLIFCNGCCDITIFVIKYIKKKY